MPIKHYTNLVFNCIHNHKNIPCIAITGNKLLCLMSYVLTPNMLSADKVRKKIKILILDPGYDGVVKIPFHTSVPLKRVRILELEIS